jgi:hypothetical protein
MDVTPIEFDLAGGLVGPPVPNARAGRGLTVCNNLRRGVGGMSLKTCPGFWRIFLAFLRDTSTYPLNNSKQIVCAKASTAFGTPGGLALFYVDWAIADPIKRVLSIGYNAFIDPLHVGGGWIPPAGDYAAGGGETDIFVLSGAFGVSLGRMTAHEYGTIFTLGERSYFIDPYSVQMTLQEGAFRESVPTKPTRRPVLCAAGDFDAPCNWIHHPADVLTAANDAITGAANATVAQSNAYPTWGFNHENYNRVTCLATKADSPLAYRNQKFTFLEAGTPSAPHVGTAQAGGSLEAGFFNYRVRFIAPYVKPIIFTGSGLNDLTICNCPANWLTAETVLIKISATGAPDSFEWSIDGGMTWSAPVAITGGDQPFTVLGTALIVISSFNGVGANDLAIDPTAAYTGAENAQYIVRIETKGNGAGKAARVEDFAFGGIPVANDTIKVNNVTFTFVAAAATAVQITIGADATTTIDNAVAKINAYAPDIKYTASNSGGTDLLCTADTAGAGANADVFTESATNVTLSQATAGANGTTDTAKYSKDGGAFTGSFNLVQTGETPHTLADGVKVTSATTDGHTVGDHWRIDASPGQALCVNFAATTGHTLNNTWTVVVEIRRSLGGTPSHSATVTGANVTAGNRTMPVLHLPVLPHGFVGWELDRTAHGPDHTLDKTEQTPQGNGNVPIGAHKWIMTAEIPGYGETPGTKIQDDPQVNDKFPCSYLLSNLPRMSFPGHLDIEASVKYHFYRADGIDISSTVSGQDPSAFVSAFKYVGTKENNEENFWVDNVRAEDMGRPYPNPSDLNYFFVATIPAGSGTEYDDGKSMFDLGVEASRVPQAVNHTRIRAWIRYEDSTVRPGLVLAPNTLALGFSGSEALQLNGDIKKVPIARPIQAGIWELVDLPWQFGSFDMTSYGLVLLQRDKNWQAAWSPVFDLGAIQVVNGEYGPFVQKTKACISWRDDPTDTETDSSPFSAEVDFLDRPHGMMILPLGYRGFGDTKANALAADPVGINLPPSGFTKFRAYVSEEAWGKNLDDKLAGETMRRAVDRGVYPGPTATPDQYKSVAFKIGDKNSPFLGDVDTYSITNSEIPRANGPVVSPQEDSAKAIKELFNGPRLHNFKGRPPSVEFASTDHEIIAYGAEKDFSIGTITVGQNSDIGTYVPSGISKLYPWMEGRQFLINSGDKHYEESTAGANDGRFATKQRRFEILQVIDNTHFRFGRDFDGQTQLPKENYYGASGTFTWKVFGEKKAVRTSANTSLLGARADYAPVSNKFNIPFENDELRGLGHVGGTLVALGRKTAYHADQNRDQLDDVGTLARFSPFEEIKGSPGTDSPRTVISRQMRQMLCFTTDRRIGQFTFQRFIGVVGGYYEGSKGSVPISERYQGWLEANVDPRMIRYAHAEYDRRRDWYIIHFISLDAGNTIAPEGSIIDTNPPASDFDLALIIDMRYGVVYTRDKDNILCTLEIGAQSVEAGDQNSRIVGADNYGFVSELGYDASAPARGVPQTTLEYAVTAIDGTRKIITVTPGTLTATANGLSGIEFEIQTTAGVEIRRVLSNTASQITITTALTGVFLAGGIVTLGPIDAEARGQEFHLRRTCHIQRVLIDSHDAPGALPVTFTSTIYGAVGGQRFADGSNVEAQRTFTVISTQQGSGLISHARRASRAFMAGFSYRQRQGPSATEILAYTLFVKTQEGETGLGMRWPRG